MSLPLSAPLPLSAGCSVPAKGEGVGDGGSVSTLRGWVNSYFRTYKGKRLGPYHVRRWKVGRKLHREYIKPEDVERVRAACAANREEQRSHREGARMVNTFIDNFKFMGNMMLLWDKGKDSTPAQYAYLDRLNKEGMYITGRPPQRRTIKRTIAQIGGEPMIVSTVTELDGTTKVFMVPLKINLFPQAWGKSREGGMGAQAADSQPKKSFAERFRDMAMEAWERVHGPRPITDY